MDLRQFAISTSRKWVNYFSSGPPSQTMEAKPPIDWQSLYTELAPPIESLTIIFRIPGYNIGDISLEEEELLLTSAESKYIRQIDIYSAIYQYLMPMIADGIFTLDQVVYVDQQTIRVDLKVIPSTRTANVFELIKVDDYVIMMGDKLGKGSFGTVYSGQIVATFRYDGLAVGNDVAVKVLASTPKSRKEARMYEEVNNIGLSCGYVASGDNELIDITNQSFSTSSDEETLDYDGNLYIVMNLCTGGDLSRRLIELTQLSDDQLIPLFLTIARMMKLLHDNDYVHGDIKLHNFMMCSGELDPDNICLTDFGGTYNTKHSRGQFTGTPLYVAPFQWKDKITSKASDRWAIGILFLTILLGRNWITSKGLKRKQLRSFMKVASNKLAKELNGEDSGLSDKMFNKLKDDRLNNNISKSVTEIVNELKDNYDPRIVDAISGLLNGHKDRVITFNHVIAILNQ